MFDNSVLFEKDIFTQVDKYQNKLKDSALTVNVIYN